MSKQSLKVVDIKTVFVPKMVDRIGELDAMIKAIKTERDALADQVKAMGVGRYGGQLWNCTVIKSERTTIDWETIALRFSPSAQLLTAHTSRTPMTVLKVTGVK